MHIRILPVHNEHVYNIGNHVVEENGCRRPFHCVKIPNLDPQLGNRPQLLSQCIPLSLVAQSNGRHTHCGGCLAD